MKVFKLEIMIIDEDIKDIEQAKSLIEATRFANHSYVSLITAREADIGEWDDDNRLNCLDTQEEEMNRLFPVGQNTPSNSKCNSCGSTKMNKGYYFECNNCGSTQT